MLRKRLGLFAVALATGFAFTTVPSPAALVLSTGLRFVVDTGPIAECNTNAKTALTSQMTTIGEAGAGTGQWLGYGPADAAGAVTAAATINCFPVDKGYVVTFTCAVQMPPNPYNADDLCNRLGAVFQGKTVAPAATPTPEPTGCALNNLVGTWVSNDNAKNTLTMDVSGGLTDQDNVVGSWALSGMTATVTHYGEHTATLSSDGKHLSGGGLNYTRKC